MKTPNRILEYFLITGTTWCLYLLWLIPFQLIWVGMPWDMFIVWLKWGTVLEMIFTYPIIKTMIKIGPKITKWCDNL